MFQSSLWVKAYRWKWASLRGKAVQSAAPEARLLWNTSACCFVLSLQWTFITVREIALWTHCMKAEADSWWVQSNMEGGNITHPLSLHLMPLYIWDGAVSKFIAKLLPVAMAINHTLFIISLTQNCSEYHFFIYHLNAFFFLSKSNPIIPWWEGFFFCPPYLRLWDIYRNMRNPAYFNDLT